MHYVTKCEILCSQRAQIQAKYFLIFHHSVLFWRLGLTTSGPLNFAHQFCCHATCYYLFCEQSLRHERLIYLYRVCIKSRYLYYGPLLRKKGLYLMKCSSEMLQNLPHFLELRKPTSFFFFISCYFIFPLLINALVYVDINQGIH